MATSLDIHTVAKHAEQVCWSCIDDEAILLSLSRGFYYTLNSVGCDLWKSIDGKRTVRDLGRALCSIYEAAQNQVESDILSLFDELLHEELIVIV